jgi:hypothetical protein
MTLSASTGASGLNASAIGYSLSGVPTQASLERSVEVVSDWVATVGATVAIVLVVLAVLVLAVRKRRH